MWIGSHGSRGDATLKIFVKYWNAVISTQFDQHRQSRNLKFNRFLEHARKSSESVLALTQLW